MVHTYIHDIEISLLVVTILANPSQFIVCIIIIIIIYYHQMEPSILTT